MEKEQLAEVLRLHKLYLAGDPEGSKVNLSLANLSGADLSGADLSGADLREADLRWANLSGADLRWANLSGANLSEADLRWANLRWANLRWANLSTTGILAFQAHKYSGYSVPGSGPHGRILQFGCVRLTLDEWDAQAKDLAERHEPENASKFEALTRAWVSVCRTMDL